METPKGPSLAPETTSFEPPTPVSQIEQGAGSNKMELARQREAEPGALTKRERYGTLKSTIEQNSSRIGELRQLTSREKAALEGVRSDLGIENPQNVTESQVEGQLRELEARQQELEQEQAELVQEEADHILQENITTTFEIFEKLSPQELELVVQTGEIPKKHLSLWGIFKSIFLGPEVEVGKQYTIILARAYERGGEGTIATICHDFPDFLKIKESMNPAIINIATEKILHEPEQNQIADGETSPELPHDGPLQIPEESSATESSAPTNSGEVAKS